MMNETDFFNLFSFAYVGSNREVSESYSGFFVM